MLALIKKELRENIRWLPVGLVIVSVLLFLAIPNSVANMGQEESQLAIFMICGGSLFAIGLAAVQSAFDLRPAARSFLFHRAVTPSSIFFSKLISGAAIYSIATFVPIACVAIWFGVVGLTHLPVRPYQAMPAFVCAIVCFILHPTTMFVMARNASWFGTKLFPLIGMGSAIFLFNQAALYPFVYGDPICSLVVIPIVGAFVLMILAARNAWGVLTRDEGQGSKGRVPLYQQILLSYDSIVVSFVAIILLFSSIETFRTHNFSQSITYAMDEGGQPWIGYYKYDQTLRTINSSRYAGTMLSADHLEAEKVPQLDKQVPAGTNLVPILYRYNTWYPDSALFNIFDSQLRDSKTFMDRRGYLLLYTARDRTGYDLKAVVSRDGVHHAGQPVGRAFDSSLKLILPSNYSVVPYFNFQLGGIFFDNHGIYRFDTRSLEFEILLDAWIDEVALVEVANEPKMQFVVRSKNKIETYDLISDDETDADKESVSSSNTRKPIDFSSTSLKQLNISLEKVAEFDNLPNGFRIVSFGNLDGKKFLAISQEQLVTRVATIDISKSPKWDIFEIEGGHPQDANNQTSFISFVPSIFLPPIFWLISLMALCLNGVDSPGRNLELITRALYESSLFMPLLVLGVLVLVVIISITYWVAKERGFRRRNIWAVCTAPVILGVVIPLAIVAIYKRPMRAVCPKCGHVRRVDLNSCENCQGGWELTSSTGIEIFDENAPQTQQLVTA